MITLTPYSTVMVVKLNRPETIKAAFKCPFFHSILMCLVLFAGDLSDTPNRPAILHLATVFCIY